MVSALWSNSNYDDDKGTRKKVIAEINDSYEESIDAVKAAFQPRELPEDEKLKDENPFFAAADRGLAKVDARIRKLKGISEEPPEEKPEPIDYMKGLDQE
jgi:hypothetical protein